MKTEKDLFNEIENVLHAHEDAYIPGAWEDFVKTKKRRRGLVYIRLAAAAAVLLMLGYAAWLFTPNTPVDPNSHQTKNTTKPPYIYPKKNAEHDSLIADRAVVAPQNRGGSTTRSIFSNPSKEHAEPALGYKPVDESLIATVKPDKYAQPVASSGISQLAILKDSTAIVKNNQPVNNDNLLPVVTTNVPPSVITEPKRYDRGAQRLNYDSLANLNKPKPLAPDAKKSKNLSYAVMVSPSVGNQKMNFGTGLEVAYNISKNFAVSSGVSYAYVNAGSNRNGSLLEATQNYSLQGYATSFSGKAPDASSFSTTRSSQSVQGVKLALSGLEVPLSFQYKTKGGFFVSAGVSAMSVIGNNLSYDVINNRTVNTPSANGLASSISVITEETTEKSTEKINGYVGFYTLSAGKKLKFGRGKLNFAPFIKVPFSRVSSENIQLIHGGVQLGFGF